MSTVQFNVAVTNLAGAKARVFVNNPAISEFCRYDSGGGTNFYVGPPPVNPLVTDVLIDAPGFAPYSYFAETGTLLEFQNTTINLSVTLTPSFKKPSHDQIVNVKANFCNLFDSDGIPIFDGFIDDLIVNNVPKALDWVSVLKAAGTTHITLDLSGDYGENLGWAPRYPIPGHDWTNDLLGFSQIIDWIQAKGFIPFIKLAADGQSTPKPYTYNDPVGWTYGWQWGMDNLPNILSSLSKYYNQCLWSTGWDGCFPDWSADQTIQFLSMLRSVLGPTACIDTEFSGPGSVGYCHMGNGAADWADDKLGILDNFSIEVGTYPPNSDGVQQTAARLLGASAKNIDPSNYLGGQPPSASNCYLANTTKKVNICLFEAVAYQIIRKQITSQNAIESAQFCANFGFTSFGNGQP